MQRVAEQLVHTNALLNKYVTILSKSEKVTKLILDERWEGVDAVRLLLYIFMSTIHDMIDARMKNRWRGKPRKR